MAAGREATAAMQAAQAQAKGRAASDVVAVPVVAAARVDVPTGRRPAPTSRIR